MIFIPLRDENPTQRRPWVTGGLVTLNIVAFAAQNIQGPAVVVESFGFVPAAGMFDGARLFGSMFLHGGLLHLGGNVLYLWVFGNNVEDVLGPSRFLLLYLVAGLGGHLAHYLTDVASVVPTIGASGAVSGLLAGYLIRFPHARVVTLLFLFVFIRIIRLPAYVVIGYWLVIQMVNGAIQLGGGPGGGVAWFEHLGGFLIGALLFVGLSGSNVRRHR